MIFYKLVFILTFLGVIIMFFNGGGNEIKEHMLLYLGIFILICIYIGIEFILLKYTNLLKINYIKLAIYTVLILLIGVLLSYFIQMKLSEGGWKNELSIFLNHIFTIIGYISIGILKMLYQYFIK